MNQAVHVEVGCDLEGLRISRELRSGDWRLDGWGRVVVVREWTWAERRRLLEACRRGQSLVVWAFNEGRGAARECDRYLMGSTDLP